MLPDTREIRALEAAATYAVEGMERLFNNGAVEAGEAHGYLMQLKGIRTQLRRLADVFARADADYGETYPVFTVDVRLPDIGMRGRSQPPTKVFEFWEDALAFLADVEHCDAVTIQSGTRRGDGPAADASRSLVPARPGGQSSPAGGDTSPPDARHRPVADSPAGTFVTFVTVFGFSSTLLPAVCPACPHGLADHMYVGEFAIFALPGGVTGILPTRGVVTCPLGDCDGRWNLSVLSREDTLLIPPGNSVQ